MPEVLEDRRLLATVTWTGNGDGASWNQGSNWDTGSEPGSSDDAIIPNVGRTSIINVVGTNTTQSINMPGDGETLRIYGGRLTVTDDTSNVKRVEVGRAGFFGPGSLRVDGDMNATEVIQIGGTVDGGGDLTASGAYDWTGGTQAGSGTTIAQGGMNISGEFTKTINGRTLMTDGTTQWRVGGNESAPGAIAISNGGRLHNVGTFNIQGDQNITNAGGNGTVINDGTFRKAAGSGISSISRTMTNNGTVDAASGELRFNSVFTNYAGGSLTGGTYLITSTLSWTGANITTNAASIILNGGQIRDTNLGNALLNLDTNTGSLTTQNGANFSSATDFDNEGDVTVGSGTTFSVGGDYTQTDGTTLVQENATLDPSGSFDLDGGTLMGSGTVASDVTNSAGNVDPGGSGGTLTITGNYTQESGGTLNVEIGGAYSITDVSDLEGQAGTTDFVFTVSLSLPSSQVVSVDYATADGTARAPGDYAATSGTLAFNPGEVSRTITVSVDGDLETEEDENFFLNLSNAAGGSSIGDPQGEAIIDNDDVDMSINDVSAAEGNASGLSATSFVFTVSLHEASPYTVTADYATQDDTATVADNDYVATSGTLTFNPGETTKTITVEVTPDNKVEPNEEFKVVLSNPDNATFPLVPGLLHYWPFDGDTMDIVGGRHGELRGGATFTSGQVGQALDCSAAQAYMNVVDPAPVPGTTTLDLFDLGGNTASFAAWVNPNAHRGSDILINKENSYEIAIFGNGNIHWAFRNSSPGWAWIDTGFAIPTGSWTFFTTTYDNGVIRTYDDTGTQRHVFNGSGIIGQVQADSDFRVCARGGDGGANSLWQGSIDELAIYLPVLDPAQIPGVAEDLRGTLAANEGTGEIVDDDGSSRGRDTVDDSSSGGGGVKVKKEPTVEETSSRQTVKPGFDQLNVGGTVTLDGTLNVLAAGGSNPELGDQFRFMTYTSQSGSFSTENVNIGNGKAALTTFGPTEALFTISPPQITVGDIAFYEGDNGVTDAVFPVFVGESTVVLTVDYTTNDGTAISGEDYTPGAGTVTFNPGDIVQNVTIAVSGDVAAEQDETFTLDLSNATGGAAILDAQGEATIQNDDPRFIVPDVKVAEGNSGTTDLVFNVALSTPVTNQVTVDVATANGTGTEFEGVVSYWPGEGDANDLVGGRHGTVTGTATFAPGNIGQAFSFDGSAGGNVHIPDPGPAGSRNLDLSATATLSGWIRPVSGIGGQAIIVNKESTYETARNTGTGTLQWAFQQAGGPGWVWVETGLALPLNQFTFYAMTYNLGQVRTYDEDGTLFAPFDHQASLPLINNDNDFRIGARGGDNLTGSYWTGQLDEIRVYDVVLSIEEIRQLAAGGGVGAAFSPFDYTAHASTLTFAPGEVSKDVTVTIQSDEEVEPDEKFSLVLSNPTGGSVLIDSSAVGTIQNDETQVTLAISNGTLAEAGGTATVTATLSAAVGFPVTVDLAFSGSATGGGTDYTASSSQIVIEAGNTTGNIALAAVQDPTSEGNETIVVDIDDVANAVEAGGAQQVTATIEDDDAPPSASVTGVVVNAGQANRSGLGSVLMNFSDVVTVSGPEALMMWNHTSGAAVPIAGATLSGNGTNAITWNLAGVALPPGYYTATLPKAEGLAETHSELVSVQPGDSDGDGVVGFGDFGQLAANFNATGAPYIPGDMDGDGVVGFGDFGILAANFNAALVAPAQDTGDAGGTYPGAQHIIGSGLGLGAAVGANDGVTFGTLQAGNASATLTVNAAIPAGGSGTVNAWIDFNNDGDWADVGEQILVDQVLSAGDNALTAAIPAGAVVGAAQARFRVSNIAGYGPGGLAANGEVEDYAANIVAARSAGRGIPSSALDFWAGTVAEGAGATGKSGAAAFSTVKPIRTDVVDQAIDEVASQSASVSDALDHSSTVDDKVVNDVFQDTDDLLDNVL